MKRAEPQAELTGEEVKALFEELLPAADIEAFAEELGFVERQRKLDVLRFCRAAVLSANTPTGGMQADAIRAYERGVGRRLARSSYYERFDESFERLMKKLARRALEKSRGEALDLPSLLGAMKDWRIVDSTGVKVRDALKDDWTGTGDCAALKVHQRGSVSSGAPVAYEVGPLREQDTHHLTIDEFRREYGLLVDLAYASLGRLRACIPHNVKFAIRLKENWKPKVQRVARGDVLGTFFPGTDLGVLLHSQTLLLIGKAIDAGVTVGGAPAPLTLRLVGVPAEKSYCFFLTNLPPSVGPLQVATLYRVRWAVELINKLEKGTYRLEEPKGERECSVKALLHASLIATFATTLLVHRRRLKTRPKSAKAPRTHTPLHAHLLALALVGMSHDVARAFGLSGADADKHWSHIASAGHDPNWRRRPSVLDTQRSYHRQPLQRRARAEKSASSA
ncbi:MAG: IS4 family transposase [Myxococcaceae bacterium]|nr:IS4 family transposase [Myxococcaceae bacterium]